MHLGKPDHRVTSSPRAQRNFKLALKTALWFTAGLWLILIVDTVLGLGLAHYGLRPKHLDGLIGIFTAPLLHSEHQPDRGFDRQLQPKTHVHDWPEPQH